ncbi:hypothetical protein Tco_0041070 [Tanacetum coccineum]
MLFGITTVLIDVNAAQSKLVLLENFNENYSKCLRLLKLRLLRDLEEKTSEEVTLASIKEGYYYLSNKVNTAEGVNAASEEVSIAELVSFKVHEPEVKGISSSSSSSQNMAFVSFSNNNSSSSNEAVNVAREVTTASTQVNTAYSTNIDNLSDAVICLFFATQPNSPQLAHEDLQQIHPDDIEEMDLRWQMAMLTMRARRRKAQEGVCMWKHLLPLYGDHVMSYLDMTGVSQQRNGQLKALICLLTSSSSDSEKSSLMVLGYKTGLESMEEKLEFYKKNEFVYVENINGLKWDIQVGEITISELRKKLEKLQKEKDSIQFNVDKIKNASERNFMLPTPNLSFTGLDEFVNKPVVENRKYDEEVSEIVRKNDDALIIEE